MPNARYSSSSPHFEEEHPKRGTRIIPDIRYHGAGTVARLQRVSPEALRIYSPLLTVDDIQPPVYFCHDLDTLYFGPQDNHEAKKAYEEDGYPGCSPLEFEYFTSPARGQTLARIQRLAIGSCILYHDTSKLYKFPGLHHFTELCTDEDWVLYGYLSAQGFMEATKELWKTEWEEKKHEASKWLFPRTLTLGHFATKQNSSADNAGAA